MGAERLPERHPAGHRRQADQGRSEQAGPGHPGLPRREDVASTSRTSKCAPRCRRSPTSSGLNIITSDSVAGSLTMRLKDVPWDQALDVVLQAKGLDMRKNGTVLWIAPKEELLTKEKLELEQHAADRRPRAAALGNLPAELPEGRSLPQRVRPGRRRRRHGGRTACCPSAAARWSIRAPTSCSSPTSPSKLDDIRKLIAKTDVAVAPGADRGAHGRSERRLQPQPGRQARLRRPAHACAAATPARVGGNNRAALGGNMVGVGQVTGQTPDERRRLHQHHLINLPAGRHRRRRAGHDRAASLFRPPPTAS